MILVKNIPQAPADPVHLGGNKMLSSHVSDIEAADLEPFSYFPA
jgi:hypothetical protein